MSQFLSRHMPAPQRVRPTLCSRELNLRYRKEPLYEEINMCFPVVHPYPAAAARLRKQQRPGHAEFCPPLPARKLKLFQRKRSPQRRSRKTPPGILSPAQRTSLRMPALPLKATLPHQRAFRHPHRAISRRLKPALIPFWQRTHNLKNRRTKTI